MHRLSYRRFLIAFSAVVVTVVLIAWGLIFRGLYFSPVNDSSQLVDFQKDKLRDSPPAEVIFVGDSSLGNCIDADLFTRLSGKQSLNLALNGLFGLEGSYEMILWALDRHPVKKVVVIQTMDMLTRQRRPEAFIYTLHRPSDLFSADVFETADNLETLVSVFFSGKLLVECIESLDHKLTSPLVFVSDYVKQSKPITARHAEEDNLDGTIRRDRLVWLSRIKVLCASRGVDLIYLHGPIYDDAVAENPRLIEAINNAIRKTGVHSDFVIETMTFRELGNSIDHVIPSEKDDFTRRYYARLKDWLN